MSNIASIVAAMRRAPTNVRFADVRKVCEHHFGPARQSGTSHAVFRTPWRGDPRVNIQSDHGKAKAYQVRQVFEGNRPTGGGQLTMTQIDPAHYTYRVTWSAEDGEYVAVCLELPSLSWLAATPQDALAGVVQVVTEAVDDMREAGEQVPIPLADQHFSGRFNLRIPETLHRKLATEAAEDGVSLNRLVSDRLART